MSRLSQLFQLLESSPEDSFLLFAIAKEHEKAGDDAQALTYYLRLRKADPGYVGLYYHLGKLFVRQEDLDQALEAYDTGLDVAKKAGDQHAYRELAEARMEIADEE
jgi:tetratricopeptide (TPR) repeat protein